MMKMMYEIVKKKLEDVVGADKANNILNIYKQVEEDIRMSKKSKVMFYQRRKGMKMMLEVLDVKAFELEVLNKELQDEANNKKK